MNTSLTLSPSFDYSAIDRADLQPSTKIKYQRALELMLLAGVNPLDYDSLSEYADSLSQSGKGFLKAALKVITDGELTRMKANATPQNIDALQALVARLEAMDETIQVHKNKGTKTHTWLSREQVEQITSLPDLTTTRGLRDYVVLSVLLGAGLRREELTNITFADILQQPTKTGMRDVLRIQSGKGDKSRSIPISAKLAKHIKEWHAIAGDGPIARSLIKGRKEVSGYIGSYRKNREARPERVNGSLSTQAVYDIVAKYGAMIGLPELQPHDCRRTFARLGYDAGVKIEQIALTLGHESIETTMEYLGISLDIESPVSDFIPISGD